MKKRYPQRVIRPKTTLPDIYYPPTRRVPVYPERRRSRFVELFIISLFVATFLLLGIGGGMLLFAQTGLVFAPSPTPTSTGAPTLTPTPDIQAVQFVEDLLTQVAYAESNPAQLVAPPPVPLVVVVGGDSAPTIPPTAQATVVVSEGSQPPEAIITTTPIDLAIPIIPGGIGSDSQNNPPDTPTLSVPTDTPIPSPTNPPAPTDLALPIVNPPNPEPVVTVTPVPTATPAPLPTPTPTLTPTPPAELNLTGIVRPTTLNLRVGPSSAYEIVEGGVFGGNNEIEIQGRTTTGEWVYICCVSDNRGWVRLADVPFKENSLPSNAPAGAETPDIRWVKVQPLDATVTPIATPTPIPVDEFPLYRYDRTNRGKISSVPYLELNLGWPGQAFATQPFSSPAIVWQGDILIASQDNHLYNYSRTTGEQNWRLDIKESIQFAPAVQEISIYLITSSGQIINIADGGSTGVIDWNLYLPDSYRPASGINIANDMLFISGTKGDGSDQLFAINRTNGSILGQFVTTGSAIQYPAIGDELIYVGNQHIWAVDLRGTYQEVWVNRGVNNVTTAPVYSFPGVKALAELYVADQSNRLFSLDANMGQELWNFDGGEPMSALAADDIKVYAAGNGFLKAISRQDGTQQWRVEIPGSVQGGLFVDNTRIFVPTNSSRFQIRNASDGSLITEIDTNVSIVGAPAISGPWIFVPGADNQLRAYKSSQ